MIGALLAELWPLLLAAGAGIVTLFGFLQRSKGRKDVIHKAQERDHEKATEIRDRVERDLPERLRSYDNSGYRD